MLYFRNSKGNIVPNSYELKETVCGLPFFGVDYLFEILSIVIFIYEHININILSLKFRLNYCD